ncbi:ExoD protein [Profundibacterium mesophilum KAUST100406-0324]|uniref:ExoD protein n=2 Tax=Profundibacterium TaxID=1258570 RepID=A0A921TCN1_9RHOB|nr:ExoD protein [Profundibacterium mesophilum KAUST100406-0324]
MAGTDEHDGGNSAVEGIFDALEEATKGRDRVTLGTIVEAIGSRGYGPFLTVPALFEITPIGAIPGVPTLIALIIVLFAVQIAAGRDHLWLPGFVKNRSLESTKIDKAVDKMRPVGRKMDRWLRNRLRVFASDMGVRIAAVAAIALCLTVPPLEIVPFASSAPMIAIAILGLAILVRDGALMLAGYAMALGAVAIGIGMLGGGSPVG